MKVTTFIIVLFTVICAQSISAETITIQDCDDVTLGNSARANNGFIEKFEKANSDTLVIDQWRC